MKRTIKPYYKIFSSPTQGICEEKFHTFKGATDWLKANAANVHYEDHEFVVQKVYGVELASKPMSLRYSQNELDEAAKYYTKVLDYVNSGKTITAAMIKYKLDRMLFYAALTEIQRNELIHVKAASQKTKLYQRSGVPKDLSRYNAAFEPSATFEEEDDDF